MSSFRRFVPYLQERVRLCNKVAWDALHYGTVVTEAAPRERVPLHVHWAPRESEEVWTSHPHILSSHSP